jgi:regulatory protein
LAASAYIDGLKMLARRELSEAQVRRRLARKEHAPEAIDEAVVRLLGERAIDDTRVAEAIARTETTVHRRGKERVRLQIERAGIAKSVARRAVDEVFGDIDPGAHLEAALKKRLRGRAAITDDREFARLFRYLLGQGFDTDQVMKALTARRQR